MTTGPAMLEIPASADNLATVIAFVGRGDPRLDLVVEELYLNIAMHADPGGSVRIHCSVPEPEVVEVRFEYGGPRFDPTTDAPQPDLDASLAERPVGGLGLFLVSQMAESVAYRREADRNHVAVRVRVPLTSGKA
jgi:anti-sigma regulatory factor (Ser/Thr protein kinase)